MQAARGIFHSESELILRVSNRAGYNEDHCKRGTFLAIDWDRPETVACQGVCLWDETGQKSGRKKCENNEYSITCRLLVSHDVPPRDQNSESSKHWQGTKVSRNSKLNAEVSDSIRASHAATRSVQQTTLSRQHFSRRKPIRATNSQLTDETR